MDEYQPSRFMPELQALPELPQISDAQVKGLRLQGTLAKALPGIKEAGSMTNVRQMEAEQYAREIGHVFDIYKAQQARSKSIARQKNRQQEQAAKQFGVR